MEEFPNYHNSEAWEASCRSDVIQILYIALDPPELFEKLSLTRIQPILHENRIIPDHQFGFRQKHATFDQVHRINNVIIKALESNKYCTAAFLDISQDFDKMWHEGLL